MTADRPVAHFTLVLDCIDPNQLATFWCEALGYANVGSAGEYVALYPRSGTGPKLLLQGVAEKKMTKNRMHVDLHVTDIGHEADRLVSFGARRLAEGPCSEHGHTWILMADPEGNEFCVCDGGDSAVVSTGS